MIKPISRILYLLLFMTWMGVCGSSIYFINNEPSVIPAATRIATPTPMLSVPLTFDTVGDTGWSLLQPGLERRVTRIYNEQNQHVESVHVWRLDQNYFRMDVAFDETPRSMESWQRQTKALMVVNGGYYSVENERYFPNGLTIVNGEA